MDNRKYQDRDIKDILAEIKKGKNVMYQLPTGGGKSVVAAEVVHEHLGKQILIIAHRRELILQMEARLSSDKITPGVLVGSVQRELDSKILIGSRQTLSRQNRLDGILNKKVDIVIVDEAHHLRTPTYDKILNHLKAINPKLIILGLSATPYRYDKKDFREYIDTLITSESVDSLISQGYLAKFRTFVTQIGDIDAEVDSNGNGGDFSTVHLSKYMRQEVYLQHLVDQYKRHAEGRQTLVYTVDRKHLDVVKAKFIECGLTSIDSIDANTPIKEREAILKAYADGKLDIIVSIGTLTEGVDLPETGCVLVARPTNSLVLFHQILGRGMRPKKDGSDCLILDCAGVTIKHGAVNSPRVWSLDPLNDPKQKTKRSKIVGKRKDGSYSDDIAEIESGDLEILEMTPEEYFAHSSNAIEEAEAFNKEIDAEIDSEWAGLIELLGKLINSLSLGLEAKRSTDEWRKNDLNLRLSGMGRKDGEHGIKFKIVNGYIIPESDIRWSSDQDPLDTLKINTTVGELSSKMLADDTYFKMHEKLVAEVEALEGSKINVRELEAKKEEFEEEQLIINIRRLINRDGQIEVLPKDDEPRIRFWGMDIESYTGFWTRSNRAAVIVFKNKKLLKNNNAVEFLDENGGSMYETNYLKLDRVLELVSGKKLKM